MILKFYTGWCVPCSGLTALLAEQFPEVKIVSLDAGDEDNEAYITKYGVKSVPTLIRLNERGAEEARITGLPNIHKLRSFLQES